MRLALTVSVKATLRPGTGMRARNARPYGSSKRYAHRFGVAANPLPVAMATGWQMEGVTYFYARSASLFAAANAANLWADTYIPALTQKETG